MSQQLKTVKGLYINVADVYHFNDEYMKGMAKVQLNDATYHKIYTPNGLEFELVAVVPAELGKYELLTHIKNLNSHLIYNNYPVTGWRKTQKYTYPECDGIGPEVTISDLHLDFIHNLVKDEVRQINEQQTYKSYAEFATDNNLIRYVMM